MNVFLWLQQWYHAQCDGEWEFREGIKILSVSNPGWSVEINVSDTILENINIPLKSVKNSDSDWYGYFVDDALFVGSGDPDKLELILKIFRGLILGESEKACEL